MFGREACVTYVCEERGITAVDFGKKRMMVADEFQKELMEGKHPEKRTVSYWTLTYIRNALAHGTRLTPPNSRRRSDPRGTGMAAAAAAIKDSDRLRRMLKNSLDRFFQ